MIKMPTDKKQLVSEIVELHRRVEALLEGQGDYALSEAIPASYVGEDDYEAELEDGGITITYFSEDEAQEPDWIDLKEFSARTLHKMLNSLKEEYLFRKK